jgi:diadenosine tetraphosphate (Ap4A) HIT family hydrolase
MKKYWRDICRVGDALLKATGAYRINYETMCNVAQALHTHVIPRSLSESDDKRQERPAIAYKESDFDFKTGQVLIERIRAELAPFATQI